MSGERPRRRRHGRESVADMVRSLGLVLGLVLLLLLITPSRRLLFPASDGVHPVDYRAQVLAARRSAAYPVLAPEGLPAGWRATSARVSLPAAAGGRPTALHIGFVTPAHAYAALEESDAEPARFLADTLGSSRVTGAVAVGGEQWQQRRAANGDRALVRLGPEVTVVVVGSAGPGELGRLAGSLRPG